ncbi:hypothetical protein RUM43_011902 [Polyplax serrata]|uniref:Thioredoxin-like protein 1 n=1 Tax=Polyplax serrata TaxID=468196 RepID=A0AAN8S7G4_POLSC
MATAGSKLVIVDFTATWCGPCQRMAPVFDTLSTSYPKALFLKVDVDKCQETAASQGVTAMPTFLFFKSKSKIDKVRGADPVTLESKIKQYYGSDDGDSCDVAGHMDLSSFIVKSQCECFNESDQFPFANTQNTSGSYLESDCDEQLIMSVSFSQLVKIHSLKIRAPLDKGPKNIKLFTNQSTTLDFDRAESGTAVQELELTPSDLEGKPINLRYVKFQNVHNIQLFVKDNQSGSETTVIEYLGFIGSPACTVNMGDFKRIGGKIGEGHESFHSR